MAHNDVFKHLTEVEGLVPAHGTHFEPGQVPPGERRMLIDGQERLVYIAVNGDCKLLD